jgi:hypothetical protein
MCFAFLPENELQHFKADQAWLIGKFDNGRIREHQVVASFGFIGNAPPIVIARLFRRRDPKAPIPYMLFVVCLGSICLQIAMKSDTFDEHVPLNACFNIKIDCNCIIGPPESQKLNVIYENPVLWDWGASKTIPQPVESMRLKYNQFTRQGEFEPIFRSEYNRA